MYISPNVLIIMAKALTSIIIDRDQQTYSESIYSPQ